MSTSIIFEKLLKNLSVINFGLIGIVICFLIFGSIGSTKTPKTILPIETTLVKTVQITDPELGFEIAVKFVLENEGGYSNINGDRGGATKFGIASKFHPEINVDDLTQDQAIKIYKEKYWDNTNIPLIENNQLRIKFFDASVLIGYGSATKAIQKALQCTGIEVHVDGVFGKKTLKNINECGNPSGLQWAFIAQLSHYLEDIVEIRPEDKKFLVGWLNRAYDVVE